MSTSENKPADNDKEKSTERKGNLLESIFTFLSAAVILSIIIYLGVKANRIEAPTEFKLTHETPSERGDRWHVEVRAKNIGDQAVREVEIEGVIDTLPEKTEAAASIDWLPGKSSREVVLVYDEEPTASIRLSVKGYLMP